MKKASVIAALGLTALGALAAGVASLLKQQAAPGSAPDTGSAPAAPLALGVYSFPSGSQSGATVELSLRYDARTTGFSVVRGDYLSPSGATHAAIVESGAYRAQIEYAPYSAGEGFPALQKALGEKHGGLSPVSFGALTGVQYLDGDSVRLCFPIEGEARCYLLFTLFKAEGDDGGPLSALPERPAVRALLESAKLRVKR